jgi:hypothetical protein
VGDPTGPGGTPADYAINALAVWVQLQGEAIHPDDLRHATRLGRKLRRGRSVWTVTFIITGGLILLGGCSKGLGLFAFIGAFLLGGVLASGVSFATSRPNRRDEAFLARVQQDLVASVSAPVSGAEDLKDEADDEPSPPRRVYGELETGPFDGPMGRVEPGDRLRLYVAPPDDDSPLRGDMTGRFLGTQLIDGRKHVVLEIVATDQGSYRTVIPVEDAGRLTKIAPPEGGDA